MRASERARGSGPRRVVCARPAAGRVRVRAGRQSRPPPGFELAARRARKVGVRRGRWGGWGLRRPRGWVAGVVQGPASPGALPPPGRQDSGGGQAAPPTPSALCRGAAGLAPRPAAPSAWGLRDEQRLDRGERRRGPAPACAARRGAGRTQAAAAGSTPPALLCPGAQPTPSRRPGSPGDEPRELREVGALAAAADGQRMGTMFWCSWILKRAEANAFPRARAEPGSRIVGGFFTGWDWEK